jgi:serine/threonine protein phosphatase PrpC
VLVCSDGLFKYRPEPADLAATAPHLSPLQTVRALVRFALDAGGADNISAVIVPFPPTLAAGKRHAPPAPAKEEPHD